MGNGLNVLVKTYASELVLAMSVATVLISQWSYSSLGSVMMSALNSLVTWLHHTV